MEIVRRKINELVPADYNPRIQLKFSDPEYQALKKSIERFGLVIPIIENKSTGNIVGGHQRLTILKDMGWEEVEVVQVELSLNEEKALNLALNKIKGDFDKKALPIVLQEIKEAGIELEDLGFSKSELEGMFPKQNNVDFLFGDQSDNPYMGEDEEQHADTVVCKIGKYRIEIPTEDFEAQLAEIRYRNGFVESKVTNEIKLRLLYGKEWESHC